MPAIFVPDGKNFPGESSADDSSDAASDGSAGDAATHAASSSDVSRTARTATFAATGIDHTEGLVRLMGFPTEGYANYTGGIGARTGNPALDTLANASHSDARAIYALQNEMALLAYNQEGARLKVDVVSKDVEALA